MVFRSHQYPKHVDAARFGQWENSDRQSQGGNGRACALCALRRAAYAINSIAPALWSRTTLQSTAIRR